MKLTLGQAAKEVGISKPSLSAAIKKGRVSAHKNEQGVYEIDPAELFRAYPPKQEANPLDNGKTLHAPNSVKKGKSNGLDEVVDLLLAEKDRLLEEKERAIERLLAEKEAIREDLTEQREQAKRLTLLLTDKREKGTEKEDEWKKSMKTLEARIANQEEETKKREKLLLLKNKKLQTELDEEKSKGFFKRLFG
jgi:hypothetical protein